MTKSATLTDKQLRLAYDMHDLEQEIFKARRAVTAAEHTLVDAKDNYKISIASKLQTAPKNVAFGDKECHSKMIRTCVYVDKGTDDSDLCIFCNQPRNSEKSR